MELVQILVGRVMPPVTLVLLVAGLAYKVRKWQKAPVANLAVYPAAQSSREMWKKVLRETFLFSSFRRQNRQFWSQTWVFHASLAVIFIGHSRLITDWPLRVLLGLSEESVNSISSWGGGVFGVVALGACVMLMSRRLTIPRVREISSAEDFGTLILLAAILASGNVMRFVTHFDIVEAQRYFATLFSLQATQVPADSWFLLHSFLVQALLIYLPAGKLLHLPGIFYSRALIGKDY
ncbi:MAG: respiratory nitrate reductase subunit gamma [Acidobacteriota bacterium]